MSRNYDLSRMYDRAIDLRLDLEVLRETKIGDAADADLQRKVDAVLEANEVLVAAVQLRLGAPENYMPERADG